MLILGEVHGTLGPQYTVVSNQGIWGSFSWNENLNLDMSSNRLKCTGLGGKEEGSTELAAYTEAWRQERRLTKEEEENEHSDVGWAK